MWPDSTEAQARNSLRQLLHQVRAAWPDADRFVAADATTVSLRPDTDLQLDVQVYQTRLIAAAALDDGADPLAERAALEHAAGLYRGDLLPASYDDWVTAERERLVLATSGCSIGWSGCSSGQGTIGPRSSGASTGCGSTRSTSASTAG